MGKKGTWFSAIKKVFLPPSKDKLHNESDKKSRKEKKKGVAKLGHGDTNSFIPLFREPSSIEKILDEAERDHNIIFRPPTPPPHHPKTPPFLPRPASPSPRVASPKAAASPRPPSPKNILRRKEFNNKKLEPTPRNQHASATKIQAAYRGYIARRSYRALKGLVRLQGVVRGQSAKRQTMNAMKYMQLLVRVQSQIRSRRIQMLENQARRQAQYKNESMLGKWNMASEAGNEDWDASLVTKEENEARLQRKVDALVKRERAMSYAYSHQLWKTTPKSAQSNLANIRSNGFSWWWNWLERQLPPATTPNTEKHINNFQFTPTRPHSELKPSPHPPSSSSNKQQNFVFDTMDTPTPRSSKSVAYIPSGLTRTPVHKATTPPLTLSKYSRTRANVNDSPSPLLKDDDSLTSCPPFSAPNYMTPTVSARAKARANSNPKERFLGTPIREKRRLWSFFSGGKDSSSQRGVDKNQSIQSVGNLSVDSTVSMPAAVGRKPFNRFV